jgi:hypothetical protein
MHRHEGCGCYGTSKSTLTQHIVPSLPTVESLEAAALVPLELVQNLRFHLLI